MGNFALLLLAGLLADGSTVGAREPVDATEQRISTRHYTKTGEVEERFAPSEEVHASYDWHPETSDPLLAYRALLQIARKQLVHPARKDTSPYKESELRGADLRKFFNAEGFGLWYWEFHFVTHIDQSKREGVMIKDDGRWDSVMLLPSGGVINSRTRRITPEERIQWGVDPDPDSSAENPFGR